MSLLEDELNSQRFSNIDRRLALTFGGLIFLLMTLVLLIGGWYLSGIMEKEQDRLATLTSRVLSNAVSRVSFSGKYQARLLLEEIKAQQPDIIYLRLIDPQGIVIAHSNPAENDSRLDDDPMTGVRAVLSSETDLIVRKFILNSESIREVSAFYRGGYDNSTVGVIQIGISETVREKSLRDGVFYIALLLLLLLIIGIAVTLKVSKYFGTPVRQLAIEMERERSFLHALISTIPDLIWFKDTNGVYLTCNRSFEKLIGKSEIEIIGNRDSDFFPPDLQQLFRQKDMEAIAAGKPTINEEWVTFANDNSKALLETIKTPLYNYDGQLMGVLGLGHDITEHRHIQSELKLHRDRLEDIVQQRTAELVAAKTEAERANEETNLALENLRRTQDELVKSEKVAALGSLVAGVAHELNTPIGNAVTIASTVQYKLIGLKELVEKGLTRSALMDFFDTVGEGTEILERNLRQAADLVSNFKQLAVDQSSYQRRKFVLHTAINEVSVVMAPALRKAGVNLECTVPSEINLDSYPGPLTQALMILVNNSLIHAFAGRETGSIHISAQREESGWISIIVKDDGSGIEKNNIGRIFEPFFTTKLGQGGSGLGLHILFNIVTGVLGGRVSVDSKINNGAKFIISIPTLPTSVKLNPLAI